METPQKCKKCANVVLYPDVDGTMHCPLCGWTTLSNTRQAITINAGNDIYDMDHAYCRLIFKVFEGIEVWETELPVAARTGRGSYAYNKRITIEYIPGYREFGKSRYLEAWVTRIKGWPPSWANDNVKACQKVGKIFKKSTGYHLRHIVEAPKTS